MRIVKSFFALTVIANIVYLLYLFWTNYLLSDYFWLLQGFNKLLYQDPSDPMTIGAAALLIAQTGILVLLWFVFIGGRWFWDALLPPRSMKLMAKPAGMSSKLYAGYKDAINVHIKDKRGSALLIRSFLEAMLHECFEETVGSKFVDSIKIAKKSGKISKEEKSLLDKLRVIGNHINHQHESEITNEEMDSIIAATERLIQNFYSREEDRLVIERLERLMQTLRDKKTDSRTRGRSSLSDKNKRETTRSGSENENQPTSETDAIQPLSSPTLDFDDREKKAG